MGPYHKSCSCRCLPPFPCIEGCAKSGDFTYDSIRLNMTAPTWSYSTASDSFRYNSGDAVVNVYNPDISEIGPSQDLRRRPNSSAFGYGQKVGSSDCQWLWNNPIAVPSKWLWPNFNFCSSPPKIPASLTDGTPYVPVNALDSTDPWDRVLIANPDYDCGDCYCPGCGSMSGNPRGHYRCGNIIYYSSGVLYIAESGPPAGSAPIYPTTGTGHWYWVFDFKAYGGLSWLYNKDDLSTRSASSSAGTWGIDLVSQPNFGGHVVDGVALDGRHETALTLQYAKEIDCDTDFEGTPVVIPFNKYFDPTSQQVYVLDTYPSSVSIELTP